MTTPAPDREISRLILTQSEPLPDTLVERIRSDLVYDHTGKPWAEWYAILDDIDVARLKHDQSAAYLVDVHQLGEWWADVIVTRYEVVLGLR